ncbi:MAG TPA: M81 family metallopeptidase [Thermomicrobiales bacterium]|nr:M81 family metallopeptidase [Thermomicrobiales bacterium]
MSQARISPITIAVGGISHETHAFSTTPTTMADFEHRALLTGTSLLSSARGSDGVLGGIVDSAGDDIELVPTLFASAMPAGPVDHADWEQLVHRLLTRLRTAAIRIPGVDGVILALHGAMTTTAERDPDGALVEAVREIVGDSVPIVVVLDSHGVPSNRLIEHASALLSYRTYPHVDTHSTGSAALTACRSLIHGAIQPRTAVRRLPILLPLTAQRTNGPTPMARLVRQMSALGRLPSVLQTNLIPGFPYHDVPYAGVTITITTDNDRDFAESLAARFAESAWQFLRSISSSAIDLEGLSPPVLHASGRPTIYADVSDNPGAGAPGDNTAILAHALEHQWAPGLIATICDPEAVDAAFAAGAGSTVTTAVGGTMSASSGVPVHGTWDVLSCGEGVVRNTGPMGRGGTSRFGRTAALRMGGITVVVTSRRQQVLDPAIIEAHRIAPSSCHWIAVKSAVHHRAAFEPIAAEVIEVDAGGLSTERLGTFAYHHVTRPIVPLDPVDQVNQARARMIKVGAHV